MSDGIDLGARPVKIAVPGAPFQPWDRVVVVASVETPSSGASVEEFIGRSGTVSFLEYSCGCGQSFPGDPMIGVAFEDGRQEEFWREELRRLPA